MSYIYYANSIFAALDRVTAGMSFTEREQLLDDPDELATLAASELSEQTGNQITVTEPIVEHVSQWIFRKQMGEIYIVTYDDPSTGASDQIITLLATSTDEAKKRSVSENGIEARNIWKIETESEFHQRLAEYARHEARIAARKAKASKGII